MTGLFSESGEHQKRYNSVSRIIRHNAKKELAEEGKWTHKKYID